MLWFSPGASDGLKVTNIKQNGTWEPHLEETEGFLNKDIKWFVHRKVFVYSKSLGATSVRYIALRHLREKKEKSQASGDY